MNETKETQAGGLFSEPVEGKTPDHGESGASLAAAPAWAGAQCLRDARDCLAVARDAIKRHDIVAAVDAVAMAVESLADAVEVTP